MNNLTEGLMVLWGLITLALFSYSAYIRNQEKQLGLPLSRSSSYIRLYHQIDYLFHHYYIDQLRIDQRGVTVTSVYPAHTLLDFDFKQNGNSKRCHDISRIVSQLLYRDFPLLSQKDIYKFTRYHVYRSNGKKEYGFSFTMRRSYKDSILKEKTPARLRIL